MSAKSKAVDGVAYILPALEPFPFFIYRSGPVAFFACIRLTDWGLGFVILRGGIGVQIACLFFGATHVERQLGHD